MIQQSTMDHVRTINAFFYTQDYNDAYNIYNDARYFINLLLNI